MAVIQTAQRNKSGESKPTRYFSSRQEKQVAKAFGGKQTKNSGATPFQKGDILLEDFMIECKTKTTHSESISIKKEWFDKNTRETLLVGKPYSAIVFNFGPDEKNYYIIDEYLFQELLEHLNNKDEEH